MHLGSRRLLRVAAALASCLHLAPLLAGAAPPAARSAAPRHRTAEQIAYDRQVALSQLLVLVDPVAPVRYVPGSLDRASHVQDWLRELVLGSAKRLRHEQPVAAVLLGRDEWEAVGLDCPYGEPCRLSEGVLALPTTGDAGTVTMWNRIVAVLPALPGNPLMGSPEEAASLVPCDVTAGLAVARALVTSAQLPGDEPWITDLLAHLVSLDAAKLGRQGREVALAGFWAAVRHPSSEAATDPRIAELARQAQVNAAAVAILGREKKVPLRKLQQMQKKGDGIIRAADLREEWPDALRSLDPPRGQG